MEIDSQATALLVVLLLVSSGLGLADVDGDGLANHEEWRGSSWWLAADTDDDGLNDGGERELGSSPTNPDTSGDGLHDGTAAEYGLDPVVRYPGALVNAVETAHRAYPEVTQNLVDAIYDDGPSPGELTAFEERQLRLWVNAPEGYRAAIISKGYIHRDDWDKDGGAQTLPNGTAGPDGTPFTPNDRDGDGILRWYYNADAQVYDLETGDCNGFDPQQDTVGELGGCDGAGGLTTLGASPEQFDVFIEIDYMAGANHSNHPRTDAVRRIERTLAEQNISAHVVVDERIPHQSTTDNRSEASSLLRENLSSARGGVFVYGLFVHDVVVVSDGIEHRVGGYGTQNATGRGYFMAGWKSNREIEATKNVDSLVVWQVYVTLHELGHVGGLGHTQEATSVMGAPSGNESLQYSAEQQVRFRTTFGRMPYYESIVEE